MLLIITSAIIAYLLGSVNFAIIISKVFKLADPRTYGSKNPGATNIHRTGNTLLAVLTLLGDAIKGVIVVVIARYFQVNDIHMAALILAVFLGHLYPIFFQFRGGKGVATAAGIFMAFSWLFGLVLISVWLFAVKISKISAVGAIAAAIVAICGSWWYFDLIYSCTITCISCLLLLRHRENIANVIAVIN